MVRSALVLLFALLSSPAAVAGPAEDLAEGFGAYLHKDFATVARLLGPLAERGEPHAQYMLGVLHARGEGVGRDPARAHAWLSLAAGQGHDAAARLRDELARTMTPGQLAAAGALLADRGGPPPGAAMP